MVVALAQAAAVERLEPMVLETQALVEMALKAML
jgi:hypothetical protein